MIHLHGVGDQQYVHLPGQDVAQRLAQLVQAFRQRPPVHRHTEQGRAALAQLLEQFGVACAVFLERDPETEHRAVGIERAQEVAPGIRFRHGKGRRQTQLLENCRRLGSARDERDAPERFRDGFERVAGFQDADQGFQSHAGHEDQHIHLIGQQPFAELQGFAVVFQRHFAHGRCDHRSAAVALDQSGHLGGHPVFKRRDRQASKTRFIHLRIFSLKHCWIVRSAERLRKSQEALSPHHTSHSYLLLLKFLFPGEAQANRRFRPLPRPQHRAWLRILLLNAPGRWLDNLRPWKSLIAVIGFQ